MGGGVSLRLKATCQRTWFIAKPQLVQSNILLVVHKMNIKRSFLTLQCIPVYPWFDMPGLGSGTSTYWQTKWPKIQTLILSVPWIKTKRVGLKSGHPRALEPDRLGLSYKANKCSDAGNGGLSMEHQPCKAVMQQKCWFLRRVLLYQ